MRRAAGAVGAAAGVDDGQAGEVALSGVAGLRLGAPQRDQHGEAVTMASHAAGGAVVDGAEAVGERGGRAPAGPVQRAEIAAAARARQVVPAGSGMALHGAVQDDGVAGRGRGHRRRLPRCRGRAGHLTGAGCGGDRADAAQDGGGPGPAAPGVVNPHGAHLSWRRDGRCRQAEADQGGQIHPAFPQLARCVEVVEEQLVDGRHPGAVGVAEPGATAPGGPGVSGPTPGPLPRLAARVGPAGSEGVMMKRRSRFTGRPVIAGCLGAVALIIGFARPAGATDAFPGTDDHSTTTATARWWYYGQTAQQVGDLVSQHHARLTQIRVEDPSVPTFAVTMVADAGDYASSWWWYHGQTADQVGALLDQHNARLISIDPYRTGAGWRFAVIMVSNTGADYKPSQWWAGSSIASITSHLTGDNMRVTALATDPAGGWDAILVASEGE